MITYVPLVRKILGLPTNTHGKNSRRIIAFAFFIGVSFWGIDAILDYIVFYKGSESLAELLFSAVPPHELYIRTMFLIASFAGGLILAQQVSRQIKQETTYSQRIKMFKVITDKTSDILAILDANQKNKYITPSITAITGYHPEELLDMQQKNHHPSRRHKKFRNSV